VFTTKPPTPHQLRKGIEAGRELLAAWLKDPDPRRTLARSIWERGMPQMVGGVICAMYVLAAVGSRLAAETYGLNLLAEGIEDNPSNTTRFLVIGPKPERNDVGRTGQDKTSILFGTPHVPGALQRALASFAEAGINLTRIESCPMRDRMWEYLFFVDFVGHIDDQKIRECLQELEKQTATLKILGSYPRGMEPPENLQGENRDGKDDAR